ncbi:MAG: hypothetical protein ABIT05_05155 [Chitinophagaceae bacterium]
MKRIPLALFLLFLAGSCRQSSKMLVEREFADSLVGQKHVSAAMQTADSNLAFWERRMETLPDNFVNGPEYASALAARFRLYGNIKDLVKADSLVQCSNAANQEKEPGIFRSLASFALLQHQFPRADSFLKRAILIDGHSVPNTYLAFDVAFETGQYAKAKSLLQSLEKDQSYGYFFRRSKYEHYDGSLDSSINYMMRAAKKAGDNRYLLQTALSNAADLNIHKGNLSAAYDLYRQSIRLDGADLHSIMGLGWIALVHDKNDSLAERIFDFVKGYTHAPDVLLKLEQVAEAREDKPGQEKYASAFASIAGDSLYGNMYSKYLIDLYTGVLKEPAKAVELAEQDTYNRPTPQVYAGYAWALFCNGQKDKAYEIFKGYVSQKPLEGLELYYMGKMMQGMNKGYNAQQFFKAAWKNRYDLSPAKVKELEKDLE